MLQCNVDTLPVGGNPTAVSSALRPGWLRPRKSDLIYSPGFGTGPSRARQLLTVHDLLHLREESVGVRAAAHRQYYERLVRPAAIRAGAVITVSRYSAHALRDWLGPQVEVHNLGNGCSPQFCPAGPAASAPRPYALFVGNFKPHKNAEVAFKALARMTEWSLVAVVNDEERARRVATDSGLQQLIVHTGVTDQRLAELYRGAKCLIFPSLEEGFGLPVVEALRCGTPVVYYEGCESVASICNGTQFAFHSKTGIDEIVDILRVLDQSANSFAVPDNLVDYEWTTVAKRVDQVLEQLS